MFLDQYRTTLQKTNRIASFHRGLEPLIYFDRIGFPCCLLRWVAHSFTVDQTALIKLWAMLSRERGVTSRVKTWEMRIIELTLRKVSQMLCAKGLIVCPDRPILLSSKATHFALNSASLFLRAETVVKT